MLGFFILRPRLSSSYSGIGLFCYFRNRNRIKLGYGLGYFLQNKPPVQCIQDCSYASIIKLDQKIFENLRSITK